MYKYTIYYLYYIHLYYPLSLRQHISEGAQLPRRPGRMQVVTHWAGRCVSSSSCESLNGTVSRSWSHKNTWVFCSRSRKPEHISTPIFFFLGQHIVIFWNLHEFWFVYLQMLWLQATKWLVLCIPSDPLWGLAREASNQRSVSKNEVYPPLVSNLHVNQRWFKRLHSVGYTVVHHFETNLPTPRLGDCFPR